MKFESFLVNRYSVQESTGSQKYRSMMELLLQGLQIFLEPVNAELLDKF
jgi:hypothetical protein